MAFGPLFFGFIVRRIWQTYQVYLVFSHEHLKRENYVALFDVIIDYLKALVDILKSKNSAKMVLTGSLYDLCKKLESPEMTVCLDDIDADLDIFCGNDYDVIFSNWWFYLSTGTSITNHNLHTVLLASWKNSGNVVLLKELDIRTNDYDDWYYYMGRPQDFADDHEKALAITDEYLTQPMLKKIAENNYKSIDIPISCFIGMFFGGKRFKELFGKEYDMGKIYAIKQELEGV